MRVQIELQAIPNQTASVLLNDQECEIQVRQMGNRLFMSLSVDDDVIFKNVLCPIAAPINGAEVLGFSGVLFFLDTKGKDDPQWEELGSRWLLFYASPDDDVYQELMDARNLH